MCSEYLLWSSSSLKTAQEYHLLSAFQMKAVRTVTCDLDQCALWTSFCSWTFSKFYLHSSVLRVSWFIFLFKKLACCHLMNLWFMNWGNNVERTSRLFSKVLSASCRIACWFTWFHYSHFTLCFNSSSFLRNNLAQFLHFDNIQFSPSWLHTVESVAPIRRETSVHCLEPWVTNKTNYTTNGHRTKCPTFQTAQIMSNNIRKQNSQ
jgi:hypothetical protein